VCCSVLQCVAACCSVLQCVAVCCSVLQRVAACCSVLHCHEHQQATEYLVLGVNVTFEIISQMSPCGTLQCVAACCSVMQSASSTHSQNPSRYPLNLAHGLYNALLRISTVHILESQTFRGSCIFKSRTFKAVLCNP